MYHAIMKKPDNTLVQIDQGDSVAYVYCKDKDTTIEQLEDGTVEITQRGQVWYIIDKKTGKPQDLYVAEGRSE